ncbi:MAG: TPM domain-containing protein [Bacilli bacterium]|jgi:hypothetical protein|nr:TPM domain-containing protein [Bacilli bacterium]
MIRKYRFFTILLVIGLLVLLVGCSKSEYPRPTKEYYVNDYANMFSDSLKDFIITQNEILYSDTNDEGEEVGCQIVFATLVVKDEAEDAHLRNIGRTILFNQWRIGKNDLGMLVLFIYQEVEQEGVTYKELTGLPTVTTGGQLEAYITPSAISQIIANTLEVDTIYEVGIMHMLCEFLDIIYRDLYDYPNGLEDYTVEDLEDVYFNYTGDPYGNTIEMTILYYLFSSYSSIEEKILGLIPVALVLLFSGGLVINRGGGGISFGAGFFRRRR